MNQQDKIQNSVKHQICILLLAAGSSTRLGSPKQLLKFRNKYLLQHTLDVCLASDANNVFLVLGAYESDILQCINTMSAEVVRNQDWHTGLTGSIRCGIEKMLQKYPDTEAVILVLCDQLHLTSDILNTLISTYHDIRKTIINCTYGNASGPPVLFDKKYFPYLLALSGNEGAKVVVEQFKDEVTSVSFIDGDVDIDTIDDIKHLE